MRPRPIAGPRREVRVEQQRQRRAAADDDIDDVGGDSAPARASTAGRLKRREPEVGGTGAAASTTPDADQRARRRWDLSGLLRCGLCGASGHPALASTWPAGSRSSTRPREAHLDRRPQRDGQHLEPAGQWPRRVRRPGADDRDEPDLGLDPGRDRTRSRCSTRSAKRLACTSGRWSVTPIPRRVPKHAPKNYTPPRGIENDSRLPALVRDQRVEPQRATEQRTRPTGSRRTTFRLTPVTRPSRPRARRSRTTPNSTVLVPGVGTDCHCHGLPLRAGPERVAGQRRRRARRRPRTRRGNGSSTTRLTGSSKGLPASCKGQSGSQCWDAVATENFHLPLGDRARRRGLLGAAHSTDQGSFTSFHGKGEISAAASPSRTPTTWRRR